MLAGMTSLVCLDGNKTLEYANILESELISTLTKDEKNNNCTIASVGVL